MPRTKAEKINSSEEIKMIADDLKKSSAIAALSESDGGKLLLAGLMDDVAASLNTLCAGSHKFSQQEFVALCESIKSNLGIARAITASRKNEDYLRSVLEGKLLGLED